MNSLSTLKYCIEKLEARLTNDEVVKWFDKPKKSLKWRTPLEFIIVGGLESVRREADRTVDKHNDG